MSVQRNRGRRRARKWEGRYRGIGGHGVSLPARYWSGAVERGKERSRAESRIFDLIAAKLRSRPSAKLIIFKGGCNFQAGYTRLVTMLSKGRVRLRRLEMGMIAWVNRPTFHQSSFVEWIRHGSPEKKRYRAQMGRSSL